MELLLDLVLNPWFIISIIFWGFVLLLAFLLRKKKDAAYILFPVLAMFKTKKLNKVINKISRKAPRFWRIFWTIGIFVSFCFTIYALWFFTTNLIELIFKPKITNAVTPLIPGVTISLPAFSYLILPLLFIMTTHELAHGISAEIDGLEVKSSGILGAGLFFLIGFGAFVEVDERELRSSKYKRSTRLRVANSGTFVNAITAGIAFILLLSFPFMISPYYKLAYQVDHVATPAEGGFNYGILNDGDVFVAFKEGSGPYIYSDYLLGIDYYTILNNQTYITCSIGDELTILTYNPISDILQEKNVTLGPRYYLGMTFEKYNDTAIRLIKIDSKEEGGINYNTNLTIGMIITEVNGTAINYTAENPYTLEKYLTNFNLQELTLTDASDNDHVLNITTDGIVIGVLWNSYLYWMYGNALAKFLTPAWPDFLYRTIFWLFAISFSISLFNMLPIPIFDGDRAVKEVINGIIGEGKYSVKKKKKEKFYYEKDDDKIMLSNFRVENVDYIKIHPSKEKIQGSWKTNLKNNPNESQEITRDENDTYLDEKNYSLIDEIGDGYNDTILLNFPKDVDLKEKTLIEVSYEYLEDDRAKIKKIIINTIRILTLILIAGNFLLSFVKFGFNLFWL